MVLKTTFTIMVTILNIELVVTSICCQSNRMLEPEAPNIDIPHLNDSPSAQHMSNSYIWSGPLRHRERSGGWAAKALGWLKIDLPCINQYIYSSDLFQFIRRHVHCIIAGPEKYNERRISNAHNVPTSYLYQMYRLTLFLRGKTTSSLFDIVGQ